MFAYVFLFFNAFKAKYYFEIDSPILWKRSITYQDVCLLDGDRPYDTFIHFQITKMHLLLYIHSIRSAQPMACNIQKCLITDYIINYIYAINTLHIFLLLQRNGHNDMQ